MHVELSEDQKIKVRDSKGLYQVMRQILLRENEIDINKEHFWCVGLATSNKILYIELISLGSLRKAVVEPMDVFSWALQKQVNSIIMVHNHPSGELIASDGDQDLTDRMIQVGKIVNIPVLDHLIISTESFYSFEKTGLLKILERSKKYVPDYLLVEKIKEEAQQIGVEIGKKAGRKEGMKKGIKKGKKEGEQIGLEKGIEKGEKNKAQEMAKKLKKKGIEIDIIVETSGLSKEEVEKL